MKLRFGVITVPRRKDYLDQTLNSIKDANYEIWILSDMGKDLTEAHINSWNKLFEDNADYGILFQDDIISGLNVLQAIEKILDKHKPEFITFYSNKKEIISKKGIFEINPSLFINEQCIAMSRETFLLYKEYMKGRDYGKKLHDEILRNFLKENKIKCYAISPCLVQHMGRESTVGINWKVGRYIRQTRNFIGETKDCMELEFI